MRARDIIVTTGDLRYNYEVIGPVYFQISNKGIFSSDLSKLTKVYEKKIKRMKEEGQMGADTVDWGFLYGEWSVGQRDFDKAFFIAVEELKKRAAMLSADAIIGMRQDIDMDTSTFQFFYLQMYGTAVKFIAPACPQCGTQMEVRVSGQGEYKGRRFYVCPNYSECKQTIPLN